MIFAAIDWAEQKHFLVILDAAGEVIEKAWIEHERHSLAHLDWLLTHHGPRAQVHLAIELHDSLLLDRLLKLGIRVYGINPKSAERARERFTPAGLKDDERDAWSLAEFLRTSHRHLRPLKAASKATNALCEWVALREDLMQERTVQIQRLRDHLVRWHPHALRAVGELNRDWALDLLQRFPTADAFARLTYNKANEWAAGRRLRLVTRDRLGVAAQAGSPTVQASRNPAHALEVRCRVQVIRLLNRQLAQIDRRLEKLTADHPDATVFRSLPHCGIVTAAAMLAGFGEDRERWDGHEEVAARWGMAPVTVQSGKHRTVRLRRACNRTIHQAWLWFAFNTIRKQDCWAREVYQEKRQAGCEHYTALRSIAKRWVKIAYRCWFDRTPYDEKHHQERRAERLQPRATR